MAGKTKRLRVLFTIPNFDTAGSGKALLKVASRLNPYRFDVQIACIHKRGKFFKMVEDSGFPIHIINYLHPMSNRISGLRHCIKVARQFRKIKPDIIHSYNYSADYSEALAAQLAGCKWVYTKKNMNWGGASANGWKLRTWLANHIAYQNHDMKTEFFPDSTKVSYVPRGVDMEEFSPGQPKASIRDEFSLSGREFVFMCVANLVPVKGIEVLIEAFASFNDKDKDLKLIIVGDDQNDYGQQLQLKVKEEYKLENVVFTGKRSDVKDLLHLCDVFVLPTLNEGRREGSPVALLESMASGCLVLGSAIAGVKDQLKEFPNLLFEAGNSEQLKERMQALFELNEADKEHLKQQLVEYVKAQLLIELEVQRHEALYEKIS